MAEEKGIYAHKGHLLFTVGVLVFVYGLMNYFMDVLHWPTYGAWMAGGVVIVLVAWAKKSMMMKK